MEMVKFYGDLGRHGNFLWRYPDLSTILLEVSGTSFPDTLSHTTSENLYSVIFESYIGYDNVMYIDYSDGTGVHEYRALVNNSVGVIRYSSSIMHYFQDVPDDLKNTINRDYSVKRVVKIYFKYPERVTFFKLDYLNFHGEFPKSLGLYDFKNGIHIRSHNTDGKFDSVPLSLKGTRTDNFYMSNCFKTIFTELPNWLTNSSIMQLTFTAILNGSGSFNMNGMDRLSNIKGLSIINFASAEFGNNSIADNLKNISTLHTAILQHNRFSIVPDAVYNAIQLTYLTVGSAFLIDWGTGFKVGSNLERLSYEPSSNVLFSIDVPRGVVNCLKLKEVNGSGSFKTQQRMDAHINSWYDFIISNASDIVGNSKFRQMSMLFGYINTSVNIRPSGLYQDSENPSTPMEKIYKMVKVYGHTWTVVNTTQTGNQVLTP